MLNLAFICSSFVTREIFREFLLKVKRTIFFILVYFGFSLRGLYFIFTKTVCLEIFRDYVHHSISDIISCFSDFLGNIS